MSQPPQQQYSQFQNTQYGYDQPVAPQQVVVAPPVTSFTTAVVIEKWSWCNLVTSMISLCCCSIFGVIATVMSILAYVDHRTQQMEMSRAKRNCAYGFGIAAIVIGSIMWLVVIIVLATGVGIAEDAIKQAQDNSYQNNNWG